MRYGEHEIGRGLEGDGRLGDEEVLDLTMSRDEVNLVFEPDGYDDHERSRREP